MASYNRVILMGHLTSDPQLRTLPNSETQVCDFALAVNRRWKDPGGADREEVLFIDCVAFGKVGQTIGESLTKGRPVHIEGRLRLEQWDQEDGQHRSKHRVVVAVSVRGPQARQRKASGTQWNRQTPHQRQEQAWGSTRVGTRWNRDG